MNSRFYIRRVLERHARPAWNDFNFFAKLQGVRGAEHDRNSRSQ
jgi:hypothetical protein